MAPIDDETLDRLLTGHLSARLDGQLGRAEPAFRRRLLAEAGAAAAPGVAVAATNEVAPLRLVPADADADPVAADEADDAAAPPPLRPAARPRAWGRSSGGWVWGTIGTAVAAAVAAVFVLPQVGVNTGGNPGGDQLATTQGTNPVEGVAPRHVVSPPTVRYVRNQTWDEGTYAPGGSAAPVRRLRHQQVEHVRVYDERRGAWIEVTVPREDVELFELDTY